MENPKAQLLERLKTANNILVTVSSDPTVDQLSAAIGLTLMLNRVGKQATAVFSGKIPSTIEFLKPEKTIEKNTDSLRDFIIALDKSKADKLRYKVEDNHVKIFITPYQTALSEKDLQFSQGDFNVEVVIALGVKEQRDLDGAITAHGRILHDATTVSVTNGEISSLGSIDWDDPQASGLSEMVASLASDLGVDSLDEQVATAFLTGIVAQTERFRNARTLPATMSVASTLMAAGANQQLIASKLEEAVVTQAKQIVEAKNNDTAAPADQEASLPEQAPVDDDPSALRIAHDEPVVNEPEPEPTEEAPATDSYDGPQISAAKSLPESDGIVPESDAKPSRGLILEPPTLGGKLTANSEPEQLDSALDLLGAKDEQKPLLSRDEPTTPSLPPFELPEVETKDDSSSIPESEAPALEPFVLPEDDSTPPASAPVTHDQTLSDLEAAVSASYEEPAAPEAPAFEALPSEPAVSSDPEPADVSGARDAVSDALASISADQQPLPPIEALNAQPFDINDQLGMQMPTPLPSQPAPAPLPDFQIPPAPTKEALPSQPAQPASDALQGIPEFDTSLVVDHSAPPSVPPPFMPGMPGLDAGLPPIPPTIPAPQPPAPGQQASGNNPFNLPPA